MSTDPTLSDTIQDDPVHELTLASLVPYPSLNESTNLIAGEGYVIVPQDSLTVVSISDELNSSQCREIYEKIEGLNLPKNSSIILDVSELSNLDSEVGLIYGLKVAGYNLAIVGTSQTENKHFGGDLNITRLSNIREALRHFNAYSLRDTDIGKREEESPNQSLSDTRSFSLDRTGAFPNIRLPEVEVAPTSVITIESDSICAHLRNTSLPEETEYNDEKELALFGQKLVKILERLKEVSPEKLEIHLEKAKKLPDSFISELFKICKGNTGAVRTITIYPGSTEVENKLKTFGLAKFPGVSISPFQAEKPSQ